MYALVKLSDDPEAYEDLCRLLGQGYNTGHQPELVALTDDGNVVRMDATEDFYRELLAGQPEMRGVAIRTWDELSQADREAFAADLGRHQEWLFPDAGPLYYQPGDDILDIITAS